MNSKRSDYPQSSPPARWLLAASAHISHHAKVVHRWFHKLLTYRKWHHCVGLYQDTTDSLMTDIQQNHSLWSVRRRRRRELISSFQTETIIIIIIKVTVVIVIRPVLIFNHFGILSCGSLGSRTSQSDAEGWIRCPADHLCCPWGKTEEDNGGQPRVSVTLDGWESPGGQPTERWEWEGREVGVTTEMGPHPQGHVFVYKHGSLLFRRRQAKLQKELADAAKEPLPIEPWVSWTSVGWSITHSVQMCCIFEFHWK